jgi:hypothetical protein
MFSLDAKVNVTILSISVHSLSTGIFAEVWTRPGNYSGYELNSTAWTKVGGKSKKMCCLLTLECTDVK